MLCATRWLQAAGLFLLTTEAFAACTFRPSPAYLPIFANSVTNTEISVASGIPVGGFIQTLHLGGATNLPVTVVQECNGANWRHAGSGWLAYDDVYQTNIPGIGIRWVMPYQKVPSSGYTAGYTITAFASGGYLAQYAELVKTAAVTGTGTISDFWLDSYMDGRHAWRIRVSGIKIATPMAPTCDLLQEHYYLNMGDVTTTEFNATGRTPRQKVPALQLNCEGAASGGRRSVYITLTDQSDPGNRGTVLGLLPESRAKGIGFEIRGNAGLVRYGPSTAGIGHPGQWQAGTAGNGGFEIPLEVNYVKTSSSMTPGSIKGAVLFTLDYI